MAAEYAPDGVAEPFQRAVLFDGLDGISGTGRCKPAVLPEHGGKCDLVYADERYEHFTHGASFPREGDGGPLRRIGGSRVRPPGDVQRRPSGYLQTGIRDERDRSLSDSA